MQPQETGGDQGKHDQHDVCARSALTSLVPGRPPGIVKPGVLIAPLTGQAAGHLVPASRGSSCVRERQNETHNWSWHLWHSNPALSTLSLAYFT